MHIENKKPDNFQHGLLEVQIIKQYIKKNLKKKYTCWLWWEAVKSPSLKLLNNRSDKHVPRMVYVCSALLQGKHRVSHILVS